MSSFWKNEWNMFTKEVDTALNYLMQPVKFFEKDENLMLKPSTDEIVEKSEIPGFWKREWNLFTKEFDAALNHLMQPVNFFKK
jgi:hypothetical protein